jgi:hypothetical protein
MISCGGVNFVEWSVSGMERNLRYLNHFCGGWTCGFARTAEPDGNGNACKGVTCGWGKDLHWDFFDGWAHTQVRPYTALYDVVVRWVWGNLT